MPRLKNVTADDLAALLNDLDDQTSCAHDYADRVQKGYLEDGAATLRAATSLLQVSRACADLAAQLLFRLRHEEDRAETRRVLEEIRAKGVQS